jgi:alkylation response protein AidB-like acyl-CoA dehydrogenase
MDLRFSDEDQAFRGEARDWLQANVPAEPLPSGDTRAGFALHVDWEKKLFDARYAVVSWPESYGGRDASLVQWLIFEEEYHRSGAPNRVTQNGIFLLGPVLFEVGTEEQRERLLRPMAAAEQLWAQAWSEPNAGSDLASLTSEAKRSDGGWLLNGQKTWCTRAAFCDGVYGLFRSDPDQVRHKGLSYFMIDLRADGVTVRGVDRLDGDEGFAEVFFDDVFVPDRDVIGEVHRGWYVAMSTTNSERGLTLRSPGRFMASAARLIDLYHRHRDRVSATQRRQVVRAWMAAQAYRLYNYQTVSRMMQGGEMGPSSSLNKIFWSELDLHLHQTALDILGEAAELEEGSAGAIDNGAWMKGFQFALAGPIYAGTNEIQRNLVAERVLGLPRK